MNAAAHAGRVHDVVGVGFGPSNLALAIALQERAAAGDTAVDAVFLERQDAFGWHRDMLLDDATMQVHFLKDLVTPRDPTSDFSFVSYLHARERLVDFTNHKVLFPLRIEFHDYLEWAAARVAHVVAYGSEVTGIRPLRDESGAVDAWAVTSVEGGARRTRIARSVVLACGLTPTMPAGVEQGPRVWHSSAHLRRVAELPATPEPRRFVVVGAGQSAAEIVEHLHSEYPDAEVHAVFSRYGYAPADDSPFVNRIFDPGAVDAYFEAPESLKGTLNGHHRNTNYSVVDSDLITELYRRAYKERVQGRERLRIRRHTRVTGLEVREDGATATLTDLATQTDRTVDAAAVVYATGYRSLDARDLLGEAAGTCVQRADGTLSVGRDYRVELDAAGDAQLFVQGPTEHSHGLGSTLLSNIAVRAGELAGSLVALADREAVVTGGRRAA